MSSAGRKSNSGLRRFYEEIYEQGEEKYFSKFKQGVDTSETNEKVLELLDWKDKTVLDVGCGTGGLLREIAARGASRVTGIDYSEKAIEIARRESPPGNAEFFAGDIFEADIEVYDVVLSCGTIEHSDKPAAFLEALESHCARDGSIVITCPHFINVRGFVWMALSELQNVPMSLTDLHFIHPWHMEKWCANLSLGIRKFLTCDYERGNGSDLPPDFETRLTNALGDAGLSNETVPQYLDYLEKLVTYLGNETSCSLQGATAVYMIEKESVTAAAR